MPDSGMGASQSARPRRAVTGLAKVAMRRPRCMGGTANPGIPASEISELPQGKVHRTISKPMRVIDYDRNSATGWPGPAHQRYGSKGSSAANFFNIPTRNTPSPMARGLWPRRADCGGTTPTRTQPVPSVVAV